MSISEWGRSKTFIEFREDAINTMNENPASCKTYHLLDKSVARLVDPTDRQLFGAACDLSLRIYNIHSGRCSEDLS